VLACRAMKRILGAFAPAAVLVACQADPVTTPASRSAAGPGLATRASATPAADAIALGAAPVALDDRGRPRLLVGIAAPAIAAATPADAARRHLERLAPAWGLVAPAPLDDLGTVAVTGGSIVRLRSVVDGLPVDGEIRVMVGPAGELIAASGSPVDDAAPRRGGRFEVDAPAAVAAAVRHVYGVTFDGRDLAELPRRGADRLFAGRGGGVHVSEARARAAWHRADDALIAAWIVEAYAARGATTDGDAFRVVVADDDGRLLDQHDLVADSFDYRVYAEPGGARRPLDGPIEDLTPHPAGEPDGRTPAIMPSALVSVDGLNRHGDPWLVPGATVTRGNNADAYADLVEPDGLDAGDFRASVSSPSRFDWSYDTGLDPQASQAQQMAAITNLFYVVNWLHDYWYDAGFTEAAGNAQFDNYGRGGLDGDGLRAEAQDYTRRNNASMATPSDGLSPRMQIHLWNGADVTSVTTSTGLRPRTAGASFGPAEFVLTGRLIAGRDDAGASPTDACEAVAGDVAGRVIVVDRGNCTYKRKAVNVQAAGGVAMVVVDNSGADYPPQMGNDTSITTPIEIPAVQVTTAAGAAIRAQLEAGPVDATVARELGPTLDGALDALLVAHEFGHYVHNRLTECRTDLCRAMGEGWADFIALLMASREGDAVDGTYGVAIYATQGYSNDAPYFAIRRMPYSTDFTRNGLTFRHMADGEPLPDVPREPRSPRNSEVHNAGEIWATMLWEAYVALIEAGPSLDDARDRMARYIVAGLLLAPPQATVTETRDALLAAAAAASVEDHDRIALAFARRGAGSCATSPPRDSSTFTGIVESYELGGRALVGTPVVSDDVDTCDDDGVLDGGEAGWIRFPVANPAPRRVTDVVVTVSTTTPGITIDPPTVSIASLEPGEQVEVAVPIRLANTDQAVIGELSIETRATGSCDGVVRVPFQVGLNVRDAEAVSATDRFDAARTQWSTSGDTRVWRHTAATALDRYWHGYDLPSISDAALVSPALTAGDGELVVTFEHRHAFEASDGRLYDGGVIEVSTDGGSTWTDVTALGADPGYAGVLFDGSSNPIGGRPGYGATNPSYPATDTVILDFGTRLAGQVFRIRFRAGADQSVGGPGWEIDDVAFAGIVGTPFADLVADAACDGTPGPDAGDPGVDADGGGCCSAGRLAAGDVGGAALILGLLVRRRRRRTPTR
jgi:hypothetical protein